MKVIAGAQSVSATTLTKISGLSVSAAASGVYQIDAFLLHAMSGVSVYGFGLSINTGTLAQAALRFFGNLSIGTGISALSTTVAQAGWFNETGFGSVTYSVLATQAGNLGTELRGLVVMSTTGGTLQLKAKAGASGVITMQKGSFVRAYKIA
jgi:hypothetical protein